MTNRYEYGPGMGYGQGFGYGRGFGRRGGAGFGFRGASPPWPYAGRGRGGMPRCFYPDLYEPGAAPAYPHYDSGDYPYPQPPTRDQEVEMLGSQAEVIRQQLSEIERRMQELQEEKE